jgi:hypothetical protein
VTEEMTEHYIHVDRAEKLRAADQVVALAGLRTPANDNTDAAPTAPASGDQVGDSTSRDVESGSPSPSPSPRGRREGTGKTGESGDSTFVRSGRIELPQACAHQNLNLNHR